MALVCECTVYNTRLQNNTKLNHDIPLAAIYYVQKNTIEMKN